MYKRKAFAEEFTSLPQDFGPVPWWMWTGKMRKPEMLKQMKDMKEKGIAEFFIFAVYGLEYPHFLQESWWDYIKFTLEHCRNLGMKAWIYDELNWPSGTAGGYMVKEYPEYRSWNMSVKQVSIPEGACYRVNFPHDILHAEFHTKGRKILPVSLHKNPFWENKSEICGYISKHP